MAPVLQLLLIEDSSDDEALVVCALTRDGYHAGTNPIYAPMTVGNYTVSVIDPVECWDGVSGANGTASVYGTCTAVGDHGVQRLTLLAARNDGTRPQHLQIVLRQR